MKIALISGTLPPFPCGVGKHTYCLSTELVKQGHSVTVFSLPQDNSTHSTFEINTFPSFGLRSYWKLAKTLKSGQFDVIHLQYPTKRNKRGLSVVVFPWILRSFRLNIVTTLHEYSRASALGKIRNMLLILASQKVILPNEDDINSLSWLGKKLVSIPLGPTILAQPSKHIRVTSNSIGFLGFLDGSKGEEYLLQSAVHLSPSVRIKFLTTLDPEIPHHQSLLKLVDQLGLADMVEWINPQSDQSLADNLQSCEVVVLPFKYGVTTRNSTLLEALSYGKPAIVAVDTPPKLLIHGDNCLFTPLRHPDALASSINQLLGSTTLKKRLRAGALSLMQNRDWQAISAETIKQYQSL